jgi:tetratricopeptide (TPR) repeat protein
MKRKKEIKHSPAVKNNPVNPVNNSEPFHWKMYGTLAAILILTGLVYSPVFQNGFVNWDDNVYIKENPLIYNFDLKAIFSNYVSANYHPLTILVLAIEYHFFKLNETGYHAVNLFLHLLNVMLVFFAVLKLSKKTEVAFVTCLLFGIHPLHVESVAWAAELKDLLYTFFFLSAYFFYLKYLEELKSKYYIIALFLFLLSLLSKAMAASLPMVLILTEYYLGRKMNAKLWFEKIPFFLMAIGLGLVAVVAQRTAGATEMMVFPFQERIVYASYGFINYLYKVLFPLQLSAYYPYPVSPGESIPVVYYIFLVAFILIIVAVLYSIRFTKKIIFGIGFFSITVFLVLQLLPVGRVIMADRYSYIPSIGIFYLLGEGFYSLWSKNQKIIPITLVSILAVFFSIKTFSQCGVWKNSITLWSDVIKQHQTVSIAYNNRSLALKSDKKFDQALEDCSKAILLDANYSEAYINRGTILRDMNRYDEALKDYNTAISQKPNFEKAYVNRGILYLFTNKFNEALADFNNSIQLNSNFAESHYHQGLVYYNLKRYDEAINSYTKAIKLRPYYAEAYFSRGVSEYYSGKNEIACNDLKQAKKLGYNTPADVMTQICK